MTDIRTEAGVRAGGAEAPPDLWDPLVRLTHWGIAAAVVTNGLLTEDGSAAHIWVGWAVFGLLVLRFVWGFAGPSEARFSAFPPRPISAMRHLSDLVRGAPKLHASHNPAGAIMAYALWACLSVVLASGLVMTDAQSPVSISEQKSAVAAGDWSVLVDEEESREHEGVKEIAEEVHEIAANLVFFLAALHIAGVGLESRLLGRNLVKPMLTGYQTRKRQGGGSR